MRISVDGSRIRNNKVAFSNLSGIVWTGPQTIFVRNKQFL